MRGMKASVIGAGLAGCEAAWRLACENVHVSLYEMKPLRFSPAHTYKGFAELVCSNSLKAMRLESAAGLLKQEMRLLGSLTLRAADYAQVPAGGALAVERHKFSDYVTEKICSHPNIEVIKAEMGAIPEGLVVIATGPLTDGAMADVIHQTCGEPLSFYDAAAPIVEFSSIDLEKVFFAARYDRGEADYINCPMNKEEYLQFYEALVNGQQATLHSFDTEKRVYEGCMPIEVLAKRGFDSIRFGPLKPVGLRDPRTGHRPWAVVQLRRENNEGTLYNIVGFQTNLKFQEQKRVFSLIPGLENAVFSRYGVMHRNTFLNSPSVLNTSFSLKSNPNIFFAGQITGVEGYMESAMSGILCGINAFRALKSLPAAIPPIETMSGALCRYISAPNQDFQPMGCSMGLLPALPEHIKSKQERYKALSERALLAMEGFIKESTR